jgi:hypothetical protein
MLIIVYYTIQTEEIIRQIDFKEKHNRSTLFHIGMKYQTDKVFIHHYENLYEKYLLSYRDTSVRLLEIGLGCDMVQYIGASAQTWREYLGYKADIHFLEIDENCGRRWETTIGKQVKSKGDQFLFDYNFNIFSDI